MYRLSPATTNDHRLRRAPEVGDSQSEVPNPSHLSMLHGEPQPGEQRVDTILVMNHHRDSLDSFVEELRRTGYSVIEARSLVETHRILDETTPSVVILNPLIVKADSVEFELLEKMQQPDWPIPVILLIDGVRSLQQARHLAIPFRDFLMKPLSVEECLHRVELAILTREKFVSLNQRAKDLEGQVSVDFKTGLLSERYFKQLLTVEFKRAQRHKTPLSLLLLDVDNFKSVNDSTEYAFGDLVLRQVAESLRHNIRETDFAARFGGDEFVLLLPQTTPAEAVQTAIRIRKKTSAATIQNRQYSMQVTVSIGIDTFDGRTEMTVEELRRRTNKALQEAKRRGKNQVWLYSGEPNSQTPPPRPMERGAE